MPKGEISIDRFDLLNGKRVESNCLEFKTGWNPDDTYHSVCAFANDFDNTGGGYIIIGAEEENGIAKRPLKGIPVEMVDRIQKEILGFNNTIITPYFPKVYVEFVDNVYIIILWVSTGVSRPYKVPDNVTAKKDKKYHYYIRYGTSSIIANPEQELELIAMTNSVPFDERPNHDARIEDISPVLLAEHLKATKSKLGKEVGKREISQILDEMNLLAGPPEQRYIKNVALMMFCETPDRFFPYMQVDIVRFPEGSIRNPNNIVEIPSIKGAAPTIIKRTMEKLKDMVIEEKITKVNYQMEAIRRFSYPYQSLEEAVVNAMYHRNYLSYEPVHIEIEPDCINIISFPGPDRSISTKTLEEGKRFVSRAYKNRRLGEFFKELELSEGHSTGIPTIQDELEKNGSPRAEFFTDDDRRAFRVMIPIHEDFVGTSAEQNVTKNVTKNVTNELEELLNANFSGKSKERIKGIIENVRNDEKITLSALADRNNVTERTIKRDMDKLKELGIIVREGSNTEGKWIVQMACTN